MPPLFSVVIPTYNRAAKVARAIRSVLDQTYSDYEIVVVDDGSTDDTAQIVPALGPGIQYVYQPQAGAAAARNAGLRRAVGRYVAFLDSDDWWYPSKLEVMAQAIHRHPEVGLFYSGLDYVSGDYQRLWSPHVWNGRGRAYLRLLQGNFIACSTVVVVRSCFQKVGEFEQKLTPCEDWDMWLRIARYFPICGVATTLVAYEYQAGGAQTSNTDRWLAAHDAVLNKAMQRDESLTLGQRRRARAGTAYVNGKIQLASGDGMRAEREFRQAFSFGHWPALIYLLVLKYPHLRRRLPRRMKRRLRLPDTYA